MTTSARAFERVSRGGRVRGYQLEMDNTLYFFGNRDLPTAADLAELYPEFEFAHLQQIHGDHIVDAQAEERLSADAHFTKKVGLALAIQTADCLPVLFGGPGQVCAAHAGWRGLANRILVKSVERFSGGGIDHALIGPHIQKESFAVGPDVEAELVATWPAQISGGPVPGLATGHFDLAALARAQLRAAGVPGDAILRLERDTLTSAEFASFRRDGTKAGRQFSFVVLIR